MNLADGHDQVLQAIAQAMQPDPELRLDEWSEANIVLPKGSAFPGGYLLSHTPYARRILQCLSPGHPCATVVAMVASQLMKTQLFINSALGWIDRAPGNILALEPSDKLAKRLSGRIAKAMQACDAVRDKVAKPRSRDNRNTIDCKEFDGGELHIVTSGSANNLAEMSARYVFGDEVDRMQIIPNEGHPVDISQARLMQFRGISKAYFVSTPLVLGFSKIHALFEQGTREEYHVPCPHCGHLHPLQRENFRYEYDPDTRRVQRAWFQCPECGADIEEHHKTTMLPELGYGGQARWVAQSAGDGETISVHLPAYYAPHGTITWVDLALQLARAKEREQLGDPEGMRTYVNTREGLPYDGKQRTTTAQKLFDRAENYPPRTVPASALVLTAFADTQPTRLEVTIEAWGPGLEHWVVDDLVLWGSPTEDPDKPGSCWHQLDELRRTPLLHESGASIYISAYGIDTGGSNTQDVYNYAAARERMGCLATKGASVRDRPIIAAQPSKMDVDWQGKRIPEGVKLWQLGADTAKDHLFNRLHLTEGPGAHHFFRGLPLDYFEQLLSESAQTTYRKGRAIREYVKPNGARNEKLDCAVGNLAVAHSLGLHRWTPLDWQRLRDRLIPAQFTPDLFLMADADRAETDQAQAEPQAQPLGEATGAVDTPNTSSGHQTPTAGPDQPGPQSDPAQPPEALVLKSTPTAAPAAAPPVPTPSTAPRPPAALAQPWPSSQPAPAGRRVLSRGLQ